MDEFPLQIEGIEVKLIGKIKWYRPEKGYGFITKANGQDIFFHRASVVGSTSQLGKGRQVEFQIRQTPKGPEAFNVSVLPPV
jgi:CspA family cold shock protein